MLFKISILDKEWCYEKFQTMKHEKHMKKGELASTIDLKIDQIKAELEKQKIVYIAIYPVHHFIVFKEEKSDIVDIYQSFKKSYNLEKWIKYYFDGKNQLKLDEFINHLRGFMNFNPDVEEDNFKHVKADLTHMLKLFGIDSKKEIENFMTIKNRFMILYIQ